MIIIFNTCTVRRLSTLSSMIFLLLSSRCQPCTGSDVSGNNKTKNIRFSALLSGMTLCSLSSCTRDIFTKKIKPESMSLVTRQRCWRIMLLLKMLPLKPLMEQLKTSQKMPRKMTKKSMHLRFDLEECFFYYLWFVPFRITIDCSLPYFHNTSYLRYSTPLVRF